MKEYFPEGYLINSTYNKQATADMQSLGKCAQQQNIIEARALMCDREHNLIVELNGGTKGIIPRSEGAYSKQGEIKDIAVISKVGKPVCFTVTGFTDEGVPLLSRARAQAMCMNDYIMNLIRGDVVKGTVTRLDGFGAFIDIGCGIVALMPIDAISVSRISHPSDRFTVGLSIKAVVSGVDRELQRITLSHKELLGTWEENAARFEMGQTVFGIVRSVEHYGIFVELTPNLAGLAELRPNVSVGHAACVYIKSILPDKMKIKLVIIDTFENKAASEQISYPDFVHISRWKYSPDCCNKKVEIVYD